jgi:hypothetical protein
MNYSAIYQHKDLQKIIESPILITGDPLLLNEEIEHNMWALTFDESLIETIEASELELFINQLLQKKSEQLSNIDPHLSATFYLWFDAQALQLRFNIISATQSNLPFGCKLNQLTSSHNILLNFISTACQVAQEGDVIEYFDAEENNEDDNDEEFILDVYVETLPLFKQ